MSSLLVFKIFGIPFRFHPYLIAIFFLLSWNISSQININSSEIYNVKEAWLIGLLTSFFFIFSIVFNEVIHIIVSLNQGVKIKNITFYFLGGILQIEKDCQTALGNIKIALVRPILCFSTALVLFFISSLFEAKEQIAIDIAGRVALLNLFIGFLNLLPVGSLDGGNLLKSIIWHISGSKNKGKKILNKTNLTLSTLVFIAGIISLFTLNFFYGLLLSLLGIFGINSSKSESQFFKIENILKLSKVSDLKLRPLKKIEFDSNFVELNKLINYKKDNYERYWFLTNNGRWDGFIDKNILKSVSINKWERTLVGDFKKPIKSLPSVYINSELWKTIERIERTCKGFLLVVNASGMPLGIIDRNKIGLFILNRLGLDLPNEIISKFNNKNQYPLGLELPKIIDLMKKRGDID